jgi:uncharacterized LabA/DUF88 family protein
VPCLFIDGANLYATAKSLGFDIDYKRLLSEFQSRGYLLRAFYYTAVIEDQEYSSIKPLIDQSQGETISVAVLSAAAVPSRFWPCASGRPPGCSVALPPARRGC